MGTDTSPEKTSAERRVGYAPRVHCARAKHTLKMPLASLVANFYIVFRFGPYVSWSAAVTDAAHSGAFDTLSRRGSR